MILRFAICTLLITGIICFSSKTYSPVIKKKSDFLQCVIFKSKKNNAIKGNQIFPVNRNYTYTYPLRENNNSSLYNYRSQNTSGTDYPKVTLFEKQLFKKSFKHENIYTRLSRIENKLFGRIYTSSPLIDRMDKITARLDENSYPDQKEFYSHAEMSQLSTNDISTMEDRLFSKKYNSDDVLYRIERLERNLFGAVQSGEINERIEKLKIASQRQYLSNFGIPTFMQSDQSYSDSMNGNYSGRNSQSYASPGILDYVVPMILNKLLNFSNNEEDDNFFSQQFNQFGNNNNRFSSKYGSRTPYGSYYKKENSNYATGAGVTILND